MSVLPQLALFVANATVSSLSQEERAMQRAHLADSLAAGLAGCRTAEGKGLAKLFDASTPDRMAFVAGSIRLTEVDDIHMLSCTTPSSAITPVALVLAADNDAAHASMADAIWVGLELLVRFGTAVDGPSLLYRDVWPTYLCAPLAAAATAARLLRLNERQTETALSIALTLSAGGVGRFEKGLSARWLLHAIAVRCGYVAALAAEAGFAGDPELFDRDWLKRSHGVEIDLARLLDGLGAGDSVYTQLSMKPYCSAKQAIAPTEAFRGLLGEGLRPEDMRRIIVRAPSEYVKMIDRMPESGNRSSTFASVRYQIALAAYHPERLTDIERAQTAIDAAMAALMNKIEIEADDAFRTVYPKYWPASVTIEMDTGSRERTVIEAPGDPQRRLSGSALAEKGRCVLEPLAGARAAREEMLLASTVLDDRASAARLLARFAAGGPSECVGAPQP